jgi:tetratricopeptide (TPR) repeat protein
LTRERKVTESDILLNRGLTEYEMESYTVAIENFSNITEDELKAHMHNNLGASYFQLGLFDEAYKEYIEAIKTDSQLVQAYYNLAVFNINERKYEHAHRMLYTCLKIDGNFKPAKRLLALLSKEQDNWYSWWFNNSHVKRFLGGFVIILLLFIVATISLSVIIGEKNLDIILGQYRIDTNPFTGHQFSNQDLGLLTIVVFTLLSLLLFPSLRKIRMGSYEIETITSTTGSSLPGYELSHPPLTSTPEK